MPGGGLCLGARALLDATKVAGDADVDSLVPRFYHEAKTHVADLFAADPAPDDPDDDTANPFFSPQGVVRLPAGMLPAAVAAVPEQAPRWKLLEERRLAPHRPATAATGARPTSG